MPKNVFRQEMILSVTLEKFRELQRSILDETEYESQYAYGKERGVGPAPKVHTEAFKKYV